MLKVRSVLLILLGICAASAVMSPPALATHVFMVEGTEITSTEEGAQGYSQHTVVELPALKSLVYLECAEGLSIGGLESRGESRGAIEFKGCNIAENSKGKKVVLTSCSVTEPVEAIYSGLLTEHGVDELGEFRSEITITTCSLKGTYTLEGAEVCAMPEAEFSKTIHDLTCTRAGGKLKSGKEAAGLFHKEHTTLCTKRNWSSR